MLVCIGRLFPLLCLKCMEFDGSLQGKIGCVLGVVADVDVNGNLLGFLGPSTPRRGSVLFRGYGCNESSRVTLSSSERPTALRGEIR